VTSSRLHDDLLWKNRCRSGSRRSEAGVVPTAELSRDPLYLRL